MSTYLFILGKDRELSVAEINAIFPEAKINVGDGDFLTLETDEKIGQKTLDRLGGVIKIAEVKGVSKRSELLNTIFVQLESFYDGGKLNYGLSLHGISEKHLRSILLDLKKKLRKEDIGSRFANQQFKNISTAQYKGLSKKGIEIIIARHGDDFMVAETIAVQNIDAYSERDYDKPFRDMRVGMLPPKLAQIIINLAGNVSTIWDPFCGGGVLIMEGLLMRKKMLGSDINEETLEGARRNVEWLGEKADLFVHDATKPLSNRKFDAVVFEGYLGPPQTSLQSFDRLRSVIQELDRLYLDFFGSLKKIGFKGPVVAALPFFRVQGGGELDLMETIKKVEKLGFKLNPQVLKYARHDQIVGRAIYRFNV
ncbi:hypothetical protein KKA95_00550 [Patescibacteria group bacterium]|nr:hypothetical protein [Patescibacteria group bacterium]